MYWQSSVVWNNSLKATLFKFGVRPNSFSWLVVSSQEQNVFVYDREGPYSTVFETEWGLLESD